MQRGVYDWMLEGDRPGIERFFQREVVRWNEILARAVFPTTPAGALDRIRLEKVVIYRDGSFPRKEEVITNFRWYVTTVPHERRFLHKGADPQLLSDQTIILHEILHQRGLVRSLRLFRDPRRRLPYR